VGICHKDVIKKANFKFNYTSTGHGSYLISTNGYTWSHLKKEFNSAYKCFQFNVGDIVYMQFDPNAKKIKFKKNKSTAPADKFELDFEIIPNNEIVPCINLCSVNDSVEIINNTNIDFNN
jgi:hypothetical protein